MNCNMQVSICFEIEIYGIFGFVACVALVLIAKQLRKVLMRREDYYDAD